MFWLIDLNLSGSALEASNLFTSKQHICNKQVPCLHYFIVLQSKNNSFSVGSKK
jgi:hypothetical protein